MNDESLSQVLQYVNAVRERCHLPLLAEIPKGVSPDDRDKELGQSCPLARAIPDTWVAETFIHTPSLQLAEVLSSVFGKYVETYSELPGEFVIDLPEVLIGFVARYDNHELPQFIEES